MSVTEQIQENVFANESFQVLLKQYSDLKKNFVEYDKCVQQIIAEQEEVISLQDDIASTGGFLGRLLSLSERDAIRGEVDKAKKIFNLHIRDDKSSNDLLHVFDPMLFKKLVTDIKMRCPTITNILEQLVISSSTSRNTIKTEKA